MKMRRYEDVKTGHTTTERGRDTTQRLVILLSPVIKIISSNRNWESFLTVSGLLSVMSHPSIIFKL